jgi:PAS domain S-box-containing protein
MSGIDHLSELDALRCQVAELSRNVVERDRALHEHNGERDREFKGLREQSERLRAITEATAAVTGATFFASLVTHLTSVLGVKYAIIGEVQGVPAQKIRTIAVSAGDNLIDNFEYDLAATPCASALRSASVCFERDLRRKFPEFQRLVAPDVEAYCGVPLRSMSGTVVGLLIVMDTRPLDNGDCLRQLLEVFAPRAAAEFERGRIDQELQRERRHFAEAQALTRFGSWDWDIDSGTTRWSDELFRIFGHEPGSIEVTHDTFFVSLHPEDHDRALAAMNTALAGTVPYDIECRIVRPDGEVRSLHCRGQIRRDEAGHPSLMSGIVLDITDRTRAELALKKSEAHFRALIEHSSDIITVLGVDGTIQFESPSFERLLGYRQHELDGRIAFEFVHPDDLPSVIDKFQLVIQLPEDPQTVEFRFRHKNGSWLSLESIGRSILDTEGRRCVIVNSRDITERRLVEEALRRAEGHYRAIFEQAGVGVTEVDSHTGRFLKVNRRYCEIVGLTVTEALTSDFLSITHPEDLGGELVEMERLRKGAISFFTMEKRYVRKDGSIVWVSLNAVPLWQPGEEAASHIAVVHDITARKRVETALRASQEKLQQALHASSTGLWDWNTETNEVSLSRGWKRQLGYDEGELADTFQTWETRLHPDDHARAVAYAQTYIANPEGEYQQEFRLRHRDGTYRWIETRASFVAEPDGRRVRLLGSHIDITTRKQTEEALRVSQERYARATAIAKVGVWELDVATGAYHGDVNLKALFGYKGDELSTDPYAWLNLVHPDDRSIARDRWQRIVAGEIDHYNYELRMIRKDGTVIWTDVRGHAVRNSEGQVVQLIGATVDATERKQAETELRRSHAFIRQVIDTNPNFIFAKDRDGRFTLVNKAVADCYGTSVEELVGKSDVDFNPDIQEVKFFRRKDLEVMESVQERFVPEEKITDSSGNIRWLQTVKRPILDEHGRAIMVLGAATDITERKRMEEMLRQREQDLRHAMEERQRISQDLHDGILQSLYAIGLGLEACRPLLAQQRKKAPSKLTAAFDHAIGQLNHVMAEIRNFIAGLESQVLQGGDFASALQTMVQTLSASSATVCRVSIQEATARKISTEEALHLMNVVREALSNSLRHSRAKRTTVSLRQLTRSVRLSITDDGIGFNPAVVHGAGRGLSNMTARAQKIGGRLVVRSVPRRGTTILVDLPKEPAHARG